MAPRAPEHREYVDEYTAYLVVDRFGDLTLRHNDDSSAGGQVDYLIVDGGAVVGALEVGRCASPARPGNLPPDTSFSAPMLDNSWYLTCSPDAGPTWNELEKQVIPVLQRMEIGGRTAGGPWRGSSRRSDRELAALNVLNAEIAPTIPAGSPPTVRLTVHWDGGSLTAPQTPLTRIEQWLADPGDEQVGMRSKLKATGLAARHAFVWMDDYAAEGAGHRLDDPPDRDPDLPTEVTHVWLASASTGWSWAPHRGWRPVAHIDEAHRMAQGADYSQ
jgi:hypothetical protein